MKIKAIGFLIGVVFLTSLYGCATMEVISQEDLKNAESSRIVARNLISTWKLNSGFIRGALGNKILELPVQALIAMNELDALANKIPPLDDYELGYSLGLRIRALSAIVQQALSLYAPEVMKYLPALLTL